MKERHLKLIVVLAALLPGALLVQTGVTAFAGAPGIAAFSDGPAMFGSKCALCHGKDGGGVSTWKAKGQPDLRDPGWQKSHTNTQIAEIIRNGKGKYMPAFKDKLNDQQIEALVGQIRSFANKK
jgi:mono/diheme cytochrome c family protein